ncbi:YDG/SRA domain-containing protein [Amycolatopsis saalfeldensis]|uniref:Putative restriction endonuclease n=1 Tax=Amycolatopsis saalfeldensis TaxID=394193 RepID=A0A1H8YIV3_9PSEU|nr:YDG/SRA domain-containing protein [Amycolatopsis saalfeldensis]SEP52077.1 putative restriction endonuclease [Amycolatopsis saalfeldensis]
MGLGDIDRKHVEAAIDEYDHLRKGKFFDKHNIRAAERFYVMQEDWAYEVEALLGMSNATDMKAATARLVDLGFEVQDRDLIPRFGPIPGIDEGRAFIDRRSAAGRQVHRALQAGIVGTAKTGAESIVVSGGYDEDRDEGDFILYTGHGGRDSDTGKQVDDQTFAAPGNAALKVSMAEGDLVRVIRGAHRGSKHGPAEGLRYDGLFRVESASYGRTSDGKYRICQFGMVKVELPGLDVVLNAKDVKVSVEVAHSDKPLGNLVPGRRGAWRQRIVRSTAVTKKIKNIHDDRCQICGDHLVAGDVSYSEGAHIQGLGKPHEGPDIESNVLCLCPSCHVRFDLGAIVIHDDHSLWLNGVRYGELRTHPSHHVDHKYLAWHRAAYEN